MRKLLMAVLAVSTAYVLGAKSGRARYEQIKSKAQELRRDSGLEKKAADVAERVEKKISETGARVTDAVTDAAHKVTSAVAPSNDA